MSDEQPLTREEVQAWAPLGPNSLKGKRVMVLFDRLDALQAELNGYAQQAGALRRERDEARTERDKAWAQLDGWATLLGISDEYWAPPGDKDRDAFVTFFRALNEHGRMGALESSVFCRDKVAAIKRADQAEAELTKASAFGDAECAARMQAQADLAMTRAALQQARDAVQPAVDAAVVAAVAAIEAERDSAYAQRDAARAKALDEIGVIIANDLAETEDTIARGKGTWPQRDYITDERWACIAERRSVFAAIMRKLSGMRLAEPTPNDAAFYRVGQTGVQRALPVADAPAQHEMVVCDESASGRRDGWVARCSCGWVSLPNDEEHADDLAQTHKAAAKPETCVVCNGKGSTTPYDPSFPKRCATCAGTGRAR